VNRCKPFKALLNPPYSAFPHVQFFGLNVYCYATDAQAEPMNGRPNTPPSRSIHRQVMNGRN